MGCTKWVKAFGTKTCVQWDSGVAGVLTNPVKKFSQVTGIKIPDKIKIGGTTIGTDVGIEGLIKQTRASIRDLDNTRVQAKKDISNAEKGEVGKLYGGYVRQLNNINPLYIAEKTARGQSASVTAQKAIGSYLGSGYAGIPQYLGSNSNVQNFLRDKNLSKNTLGVSENFAGYTRGTSTLTNKGYISNDDRNNIYQGYTKVAAVATGVAAYSYLTAPAAVAPTGGAVPVAGGVGYTAPVVTSTEIGTGVVTTYGGTGATAAGLSSYLPSAGAVTNAGLLYTAVTGKQAPTSIGDLITNPSTQPDLGFIGDLIGGSGRQYMSPDVVGDGGGYASGGDYVQEPGMSLLVLGALAVGAYILFRKFA